MSGGTMKLTTINGPYMSRSGGIPTMAVDSRSSTGMNEGLGKCEPTTVFLWKRARHLASIPACCVAIATSASEILSLPAS